MNAVQLTVGRWAVGTDEVGGLVVRSPSGRLWYPSLAAERSAGSEVRWLIEFARLEPHRGTWA